MWVLKDAYIQEKWEIFNINRKCSPNYKSEKTLYKIITASDETKTFEAEPHLRENLHNKDHRRRQDQKEMHRKTSKKIHYQQKNQTFHCSLSFLFSYLSPYFFPPFSWAIPLTHINTTIILHHMGPPYKEKLSTSLSCRLSCEPRDAIIPHYLLDGQECQSHSASLKWEWGPFLPTCFMLASIDKLT